MAKRGLSVSSIIFTSLAAIFISATLDAGASDQQIAESEFGILKVAKGVEETYYNCVACHSEMIVAQQGLTRQGWDEVLVWMVDEQDMPEIEELERNKILDYLATHYNEDRPNFPK